MESAALWGFANPTLKSFMVFITSHLMLHYCSWGNALFPASLQFYQYSYTSTIFVLNSTIWTTPFCSWARVWCIIVMLLLPIAIHFQRMLLFPPATHFQWAATSSIQLRWFREKGGIMQGKPIRARTRSPHLQNLIHDGSIGRSDSHLVFSLPCQVLALCSSLFFLATYNLHTHPPARL